MDIEGFALTVKETGLNHDDKKWENDSELFRRNNSRITLRVRLKLMTLALG